MVFPTFFNLSLNLLIRSSCSEPQSAPGLVFVDCIELLSDKGQRRAGGVREGSDEEVYRSTLFPYLKL